MSQQSPGVCAGARRDKRNPAPRVTKSLAMQWPLPVGPDHPFWQIMAVPQDGPCQNHLRGSLWWTGHRNGHLLLIAGLCFSQASPKGISKDPRGNSSLHASHLGRNQTFSSAHTSLLSALCPCYLPACVTAVWKGRETTSSAGQAPCPVSWSSAETLLPWSWVHRKRHHKHSLAAALTRSDRLKS